MAYYMHWSRDEVMSLSHRERLRWCEEISDIHGKINREPENDIFRI